MRLDREVQTQPSHVPVRRGVNWRRAGKFTLIFGAIFAILLAGTGVALWKYVDGKWKKGGLSTAETSELAPAPPLPKDPINILVLGSDRRDVIEGKDKSLGQYRGGKDNGRRSDTLMLVHLTGEAKSAVVLSFPRDLRVKIPGHTGSSKINAAYNEGPNKVIETVKALTGIPIHHYVEINFSSFRSIVSAVGGVNMCVTRSYADRESGLYIQKPGCYDFDGNKALAFVRMRKADPNGDFGRIDRQQLFIRTLMHKVKSLGTLANPVKVVKLANALSSGVLHDADLSLGLLRGIANKLAGYGDANVDFRVVPSHSAFIGGVSYVLAEEQQAQAIYAALRDGTAMPSYGRTSQAIPEPKDVSVDVYNGTPTTGMGRAWADQLEKDGFKIRRVTNAEKRDYKKSWIVYAPGAILKAKLLAEKFPEAIVRQSLKVNKADVWLVVGTDLAARLPSASPSASPSR